MAMKKRFYSVNGQMMGYESGGVKKDFLTDHLGSITAEIDQTQTRTYDTRYSAYGRNNWSTGTGCGFGWVGSYGYRETGLFHMSHYVRARHYSYLTGGWSTVDPLFPSEYPYLYVRGLPTHLIDPTGLWCFSQSGDAHEAKGNLISLELWKLGRNPDALQKFLECIQYQRCQRPQGLGDNTDNFNNLMNEAGKDCKKGFRIHWKEGGIWPLYNKCNDEMVCMWTEITQRPPAIIICKNRALNESKCGPLHCQLAHELLHVIGFSHEGDDVALSCVQNLPGCENYNPTNVKHHPKVSS